MKIIGQYLDGIESKAKVAQLEVIDINNFSINITNNDTGQNLNKIFLFKDIKIESRLGNTPRQIMLPENQSFITLDHPQIELLQKKYQPSILAGTIHFLESHLLLAIFALIIAAGSTLWFTTYGIPKAAEMIAENIPYNDLGNHSLTVLDNTLFSPSELSLEEQQRVLDIVKPYIKEYPSVNPTLLFRSGMPANALALPDGNIVLTDEFVKLADIDEEILSVLFHEIGHIKNKHITRRAIQGTALTMLVFFITGDLDLFDFTAAIPAALMDLSYSREFEREADKFAIQEMSKFNIDHSHFINIMRKLEYDHNSNDSIENNNDFKVPEFFSTHPLTEERIQLYKDT